MSNQNNTALDFSDDFSFSNREVRIVTKIPTAENAIVAKFLKVPAAFYGDGKQVIWYARYFQHAVGPDVSGSNRRDLRWHVCQKFLGSEKSPENDAYWDAKKALADLKRAGEAESLEAKKLELVVSKLEPKDNGYVFFVEPESPTIKVLKVSQMIINQIKGRPSSSDKYPEIPSVVETMLRKGMSPLNITSEAGWVKIYKTGEGLATRYHIEPYMVEKEEELKDGRKIAVQEPFKAKVHHKIYNPANKSSDVTLEDFPNPRDFENKFAFTYEEAKSFVKTVTSGGSIFDATPPRLLPNQANRPAPQPAPVAKKEQPLVSAETDDDMPF